MTRSLVIGNGQLLLCFDERLALRDLYYPHVGQVNHVEGERNQIGIWTDGSFSWVGEAGWDLQLGYEPNSLVTRSAAVSPELGLELVVRDAVHFKENLCLRHVRVHNRRASPRQVRTFFPFDLDLDGTDIGDTAYWDPNLGVIIHYKRDRWCLIGASGPQGGPDQFATGRKRFAGAEGTWRDAEDGHLEGHPISQGSVDSTIRLAFRLDAYGTADLYQWLVVDRSAERVQAGHRRVLQEGPRQILDSVQAYWAKWAGEGPAETAHLPADLQAAYRRSLLTIRTQVDRDGAILAANDSDILRQNRDHYSYMWPRDGALVAAALARAGKRELTDSFFRFCAVGLSPDGFLWHKYNPDGTLGSSWHPWLGAKGVQLPIQEDETALVLWALYQSYQQHRDVTLLGDRYQDLVVPAADFLAAYRDGATGLPEESYDLWEERRGIFTFTAASVAAGLHAAAAIASILGDEARRDRYHTAATSMRQAIMDYLWSAESGSFRRGVYRHGNGELVPDETPESSVLALFFLGLLPAADPKVDATAHFLRETLWSRTEVGGLARYYNDYYFRVGTDPKLTPGNPWIICTLWLARWHIARAETREQLERGIELIRWALERALPSGLLPEQVDPFTGAPLSVTPLTWSHATLLDALLDLAERLARLEG